MIDPTEKFQADLERFQREQLSLQGQQRKVYDKTMEEWREHLHPHNGLAVNPLEVEIAMYRRGMSGASLYSGFRGQQYHLRQILLMLYPDLAWHKWMDQLVEAWCSENIISVMAHGAASKSFMTPRVVWAHMLAGMDCSTAIFTCPSKLALRQRIWNEVERSWGPVRTLGMGKLVPTSYQVLTHLDPITDKWDQKAGCHGIATEEGEMAVEKIRGLHNKRMVLIVDEADGTPDAIFDSWSNLKIGTESAKFVMLSNPSRRTSMFARYCEPESGWQSVTINDAAWRGKKGNLVLHWDGLLSPNIVAGKEVHSFLIKQADIEDIVKRWGEESPQYYTQVRGWYPPDEIGWIVCPAVLVDPAVNRRGMLTETVQLAALDPAFEGGDRCILMRFALGRQQNGQWGLQWRETFNVPRNVSVKLSIDRQISDAVVQKCKIWGVAPFRMAVDTTGGGRGPYAMLCDTWSPEVISIAFNNPATERPLKWGEIKQAKETCFNFRTEMWWAMRIWFQENQLFNIPPSVASEVCQIPYKNPNFSNLVQLPSKKDIRKLLGYSPDEGDALAIGIELARRLGAWAGPADGKGFVGRRNAQLEVARKQHDRYIPNDSRYLVSDVGSGANYADGN